MVGNTFSDSDAYANTADYYETRSTGVADWVVTASQAYEGEHNDDHGPHLALDGWKSLSFVGSFATSGGPWQWLQARWCFAEF